MRVSSTTLQRTAEIVMVLGIQAVIDLAVPQISFTAHGIGLVVGLLLGWLLMPARRG